MALELKKFVRRIWGSSSDLKRHLTQIQPVVGRGLVRVWHRVYIWRYKLRLFVVRHGAFANCIAFIVAIGASILAIPVLEHLLETHFTSEAGLSMLRTLLVTLGGALIGATAIAFSIVMFAVQINFARMPHGLFRRLSSDFRLLGAFALTFVLAIVVASLSLVPNASWSAVALLTAIWSTILILILFLSQCCHGFPTIRIPSAFVENFGLTELLFEVALDAQSRGGHDVAESTRELLVSWAFKGGHHHTGWAILERSILALITLVLWKEDADLVPWLRTELAKGLHGQEAPDQELRDRAARGLREKAETLYRRELELSRINHAMGQIDPAKLRPLLHEIANLLSPGTAGEPVDLGF